MTSPSNLDDRVFWAALAPFQDPAGPALIRALGYAGARAIVEDRDVPGTTAALMNAGVAHDAAASVAKAWADQASFATQETQRRLDPQTALVDPSTVPGLSDLGESAPHVLFVRGDVEALRQEGVGLVGARASTSAGERAASMIAGTAVDAGYTVISGGAWGIDSAAHRGALHAEGVTVAYLAGGLNVLYPSGNRDLFDRIVRNGGALVTEAPFSAGPTRARFLARNRLIAAASRATVVVEAGSRSGSMNTVGRAAGLGRPIAAVMIDDTQSDYPAEYRLGPRRAVDDFGAVPVDGTAAFRRFLSQL